VPLPAQTQAPFVYFYAICHSRMCRLAVSGGSPAAGFSVFRVFLKIFKFLFSIFIDRDVIILACVALL
jgi:hypothetical protein